MLIWTDTPTVLPKVRLFAREIRSPLLVTRATPDQVTITCTFQSRWCRIPNDTGRVRISTRTLYSQASNSRSLIIHIVQGLMAFSWHFSGILLTNITERILHC